MDYKSWWWSRHVSHDHPSIELLELTISGPAHIYYFRDGVSEGQYAHVLNQEVEDMKKSLADTFGADSAAGVSHPTLETLDFTHTKIDQMDCHCLHQASSHSLLPQGRRWSGR